MTKRRPLPTRAWKMVEMRKKTTPLEAEKAFKKLEGLGSSNGRFNGPTHAQVLIRKPLREVNSNTVKNDLGPGPASGHSEAHTLDVLDEHIKVHKLPLVKSLVTPSDGNCWYSAVCDQIRLTNIHGKPNTPDSLRKTICDVIPSFPQAQFWITKLFHGQSGFRKFLTHHKKNGEWTFSLRTSLFGKYTSFFTHGVNPYSIQEYGFFEDFHVSMVPYSHENLEKNHTPGVCIFYRFSCEYETILT